MKIFDQLFHLVISLCCGLALCTSQIVYAGDIEDSNSLFKNGQYNLSLDKVNGYLADHPKDAQGRFLKGLILTEQGKTMDAIKIFSALTDDYPELPEPYNNLAVLYAGQGQYEKAKLALEMALRTHPSYATAHENLGDIYSKMASLAYDRALQLDHNSTSKQTKLVLIKDLFSDDTRDNYSSSSNNSNIALVKAETTTSAIEMEKNSPAIQAEQSAMVSTKPDPVVPTPTQIDQNKEVLKTVNAWAAAWSSQDANSYLSFYAADFKTPNNESRKDWEIARRERVTTPKFIQVSVSNAVVKISDTDHAMVNFRQSYRANHLKATGNKTLLMVKSGDNWLIQEERSR